MYIDGLGLLHNIPGLDFIIYADDLCLFTNTETELDSDYEKQILQFGVRYVQWYAANLGLSLNSTKTMYQHFTRHTRNRPITLYFDDQIYTNQRLTENYHYTYCNNDHIALFKVPDQATKYIGYYLNKRLDWTYHTDKMLHKCKWIFNGMLQNLRKIWRIKNEIVIRLIETCVFSIIDYSAVFFTLFPQKQLLKN